MLLVSSGIFVLTTVMVGISSLLLNADINHIISNTVMASVGSLFLVFVLHQNQIMAEKSETKEYHLNYFFIIYIIGLVLSCIFPLMPKGSWFCVVVGIALALFSNYTIGIVSSSVLITISVLLGEAEAHIFILYFTTTFIGIMVFQHIDKQFKIIIPSFITLMTLLISTVSMNIMFLNSKLDLTVFIVPITNFFITGILLLIVLKCYSYLIIHKSDNKFLIINDQEHPLLKELKARNAILYYNAIHCSYLCEKIARELGLDSIHLKALGYYHNIGYLRDDNSWISCKKVCVKNEFPESLRFLLQQYLDRSIVISSAEVLVLIYVDEMITYIMEQFNTNAKAVIDYESIVAGIDKMKNQTDNLDDNNLTLAQMKKMKKILKEETLYYDFLR